MFEQNKKISVFFAFLSGTSVIIGLHFNYEYNIGVGMLNALLAIIFAMPDNKK